MYNCANKGWETNTDFTQYSVDYGAFTLQEYEYL